MRDRTFAAFAGSLAVAAAAVWLSSGSLIADQATNMPKTAPAAGAKASAKPYSPPRTPDGHPDLQGLYDVATMTPVDRPNGASLILSDKEAAAL